MQSGSVSYSRIAERYEAIRGGDSRAVELSDALVPWLPDRGLVCDVGAGTGVVTHRLHTSDREVIACDLSVEMISQASERLPRRLCVADAQTLPVTGGSVDAVTYVWVLHHVGDLVAAMTEAHRVLRIGGRVLSISGMSIPAPDDMAPIFEGLSNALRPERHKQAESFMRSGRDAGFSVAHEGFARTTAAVSPHGLADAIVDRQFSHLWDLPDDQWASHVVPAIDDLRSLPSPHIERQRVFDHPFVVLTKTDASPPSGS